MLRRIGGLSVDESAEVERVATALTLEVSAKAIDFGESRSRS